MEPELLRYLKILVKFAIFVLFMLSIYLLFSYVFPILGKILTTVPLYFLPFILAILLAIMIEPVISFFQRRARMGRGLATLFSILVVIGGLVFVVIAIASRIIVELNGMYQLLSGRSSDLGVMITDTLQKAQLFYLRLNLPREVENSLQTNLYKLIGGLQDIIEVLVTHLISFVTGLPGFFILFLIALVATYFIAKERPQIRDWFLTLFPPSWEGATRNIMGDLIAAFVGFLKAEAILVSITGLQALIGLKLLGVEYALTLGLLTGLLDIMPVLGPGTLFVPWIIWEFIVGHFWFAIGLLALYTTMITVRYFLEPRLVGEHVGLHPLATLVSLYVGLKAAGPLGMIMGPIVVIFYLACKRAGLFDKFSWKRTG